MKKCKINDCDKKVHHKELCSMHYTRFLRYGNYEKPKNKREKLIELGYSYCPACKKEKLLSEFNKDNNAKYKIAIYCRQCNSKKANLRYKNHKDTHKNNQLRNDFNITLDQYHKMLDSQNHKCAICKKEEIQQRNLSVDHCHKTGKVRGLLCANCNLGLGKFKDDVILLEKAVEYLKNTK